MEEFIQSLEPPIEKEASNTELPSGEPLEKTLHESSSQGIVADTKADTGSTDSSNESSKEEEYEEEITKTEAVELQRAFKGRRRREKKQKKTTIVTRPVQAPEHPVIEHSFLDLVTVKSVDPTVVGKGVCFDIAKDPDAVCKKSICKPTAPIKREKGEGVTEKIIKKICRPEKDESMLTCINRHSSARKMRISPLDTSKCRTVTETIYAKTPSTKLTSQKNKVEIEESTITTTTARQLQASRSPEHEGTEDKDSQKEASVGHEGVEGAEAPASEAPAPEAPAPEAPAPEAPAPEAPAPEAPASEAYPTADAVPSEMKIEVCECCKCHICRCEPKFVTKFLTEEEIRARIMKGLQSGRSQVPWAERMLTTKYSWDTIVLPRALSDWDFEKEQHDAREAEKKILLVEVERLEKEREQYEEEVKKEEKEEKEEGKEEVGEHEEAPKVTRDVELDWATYKAMEWAGLQHEFTEPAQTLATDISEDQSMISWTSQPPAQMILGTVGPYKIRHSLISNEDISLELGKIKERSRSFLRLGPKGVFMKEDEMDEETEKKGKKEVRLSKVVQELRSPSETTAMTEGSRKTYEDRPEFYESHVRLTTKEAMNLRRKSMKPKRESTRSHSGTLRRQAALIPEQTSASTASSKPISTRSLSASAASRLAYLESLGANLRSFSCPCLPGYCTCEGPSHWTYRDSKSLNLSDEVEEEKYRRLEEISMGKVERTDSELKAKGIYVWKSNECPCLHEEDKDKLLPKSSEELVVVAASPAPKQVEEEHVCTCTKRFEKTLVILKPDALVFKDVVKRALIHIGGLEILNERIVRLSPEQVSEIYSERYLGSAYFPLFVVQLSRYPIMILSVAGMNAVRVVNAMIGSDRLIPEAWLFPESIKRKIGLLKNIEAELRVSENAEQAALETRYFFPQSFIEPIPTIPNRVSDYCGKYVNPTLSKGLATVAKARPVDPVLFLAEWLLTHNPYQPWYNPQSINIIPT